MQDARLAHEADPQAIIQLPVKLREELGSEVQIHGAIGTAAHTSGGEAEDVRSLATRWRWTRGPPSREGASPGCWSHRRTALLRPDQRGQHPRLGGGR